MPQTPLKFAGLKDKKCREIGRTFRRQAKALTDAQKNYIRGPNYAIMKKKREGKHHEEGKT